MRPCIYINACVRTCDSEHSQSLRRRWPQIHSPIRFTCRSGPLGRLERRSSLWRRSTCRSGPLGRSGPLWPIKLNLVDQVHFGRSSPLWPIMSTLVNQVHFGRSGPLWLIKSTLADQVHFGRSGPLWPIRFALADKVNFGRSRWQIRST